MTEIRRKHPRKQGKYSVLSIGGKEFEIQDWSRGGVCFNGFDIPFAVGDELRFKMIFELAQNTIAVEHKGRIVRTSKQGDNTAVVFEPFGRDLDRQFDRIIDGIVTEEFVQSQAV